MPKKSYIRIKDTETGKYYDFRTYREAAEFCSKLSGTYVRTGVVYNAVKNCGGIANGRFATCPNEDGSIPTPDMTSTEDGWLFVQFEVSPTVLTAEKKLKWYKEERMEDITQILKENRCRVIWDMSSEKYQRQNTRVEIYKKFPQDIGFREKVRIMKEILNKVGL